MVNSFAISDCYEPATACLEAAVLLSNGINGAYEADARGVIRLICLAYDREDVSAELEYALLHQLCDIKTSIDGRIFLSQNMSIEGADEDVQLLAQNKCRILCDFSAMIKNSPDISAYHCLDYSSVRTYNAGVRYAELSAASAAGNPAIVRQVGIMQALGIGCEKNAGNAIRRLKQCSMWGDICSMRLLAKLHAAEGERERAETTAELADLCSLYLKEGITVLPDAVQKKEKKEAVELYNCVSTIYYDLVMRGRLRNIDLSFVEALLHTKSYSKRMEHINNYKQELWKDETNPGAKISAPIGFRG